MLLDVKGHPIPFASPSSPKTHIPDGLGCPIEGFHLNCVSSSIPFLYTEPFSLLPSLFLCPGTFPTSPRTSLPISPPRRGRDVVEGAPWSLLSLYGCSSLE